jgi:CBS domain-containing protein
MGLQQNLQDEPVRKLSLRVPATAIAETTVRDAIMRMRERKLGCTVVVDDNDKPIGIFTESALTQLMIDPGPQVVDEPIAEHMSQYAWVKLTDPITYVLEAMQLKNVRFLCVLDEDGRLAGLTGQKSLIEFVADHFPSQVMVQRIGGEPYTTKREGA